MPNIEVRTRKEIAAFLPGAIQSALDSYIAFSKTPEQAEAKQFKDHHDACEVCIAHIKLLIELAKWADIPPPELADEIRQQQLAEILGNANSELGR